MSNDDTEHMCRVHCDYGACEAYYLRPHKSKPDAHWVRLKQGRGYSDDPNDTYKIPPKRVLIDASQFDCNENLCPRQRRGSMAK